MRKFEVVACVFKNCTFSSNIYSTFASHRHRKHSPHGLQDFKEEVLKKYSDSVFAQEEPLVDTEEEEDPQPLIEEDNDLSQIIKEKFGSLFLKLESTF